MSEDYKDKLNVIGCYNCIHDGSQSESETCHPEDVRICHVHIADIGDDGYEYGLRFKEGKE